MPCGRGHRVTRAADDSLIRDQKIRDAEAVSVMFSFIPAPEGVLLVDCQRTLRTREDFIRRRRLPRKWFDYSDGLPTYKVA